jgi:hypothetical protein
MDQCVVCGNHYDKTFEVKHMSGSFTFDCFECAIYKLAPRCERCSCVIIGHGVESSDKIYCCAHCAKKEGVHAKDRV